MSYDLAKLKFGGTANSIAEHELAASFSDDEDDRLFEQLYREYQEDGSPKNTKAWLRRRLKELFVCVEEPPRWIESESLPRWPFHNGRPMVFIRQFAVPTNDLSGEHLSPGVMLYVFGLREDVPEYHGWQMRYTVTEQHPGLP